MFRTFKTKAIIFIKGLLLLLLLGFSQVSFATNTIIIDNLNNRFNIERNQVNCMYQDNIGFIWFGVVNGLYKFDNSGFKRIESKGNSNLRHPDIRAIIELEKGKLILGTYDHGLILYNSIYDNYEQLTLINSEVISNIQVNCMLKESNDIFWVGSKNGLYKIASSNDDKSAYEVLEYYSHLNPDSTVAEVFDIKINDNGELWFNTMSAIGTINEQTKNAEIYITSEAKTSFIFLNEHEILYTAYNIGLSKFNITSRNYDTTWTFGSSEEIFGKYVYRDNQGDIWLSLANKGLVLLDSTLKYNNAVKFLNSSDKYNSINSNLIYYINESQDGTIFLCTESGINAIHNKNLPFNSIPSNFNKKESFYYGIRAIEEIDKNNVVLGTMGDGLKTYNTRTNTLTHLTIQPGNKELGKRIQTIIKDHNNTFWIGTEGNGVFHLEPLKSNTFSPFYYTNYKAFPVSFPAKSLLNDFIMAIIEDREHNIWFGTWYGLSLLSNEERKQKDRSKIKIVNFLTNETNDKTISSNTILCLLQDHKDNIWVGTQKGLNKINYIEGQYQFVSNIKDPNGNSLNSRSVTAIFETHDHQIWFSTNDGGICLLNTQNMLFYEYNSNNGFIDHIVNSINEDKEGNLWLGTGGGVCRYDPKTNTYKLYKEEDGLISNFNLINATGKQGDNLFFGTDKGLVYFDTDKLKQDLYKKSLVFTDIKIFNTSLKVGSSKGMLAKTVPYCDEIELKYDQNFITFEFSTLNFDKQKDVQYSCILEGVENTWNNLGAENKITYTNLDHGTYTFKVKAYDTGFRKNAEERSVKIIIRPPLWKTNLAYVLYLILFVLAAFYLYRYFISQEKKKSSLALERLNAKKQHEIDIMKLRFFMNVSHEFRTPLTLISAPLETLLRRKFGDSKLQSYLTIMFQNVKKLQRLIDELLELRKIDAGYLKVSWKLGNVIEFHKRLFDSFQGYAEKRDILFEFNSKVEELNMYFDADKLDKVVFNLLSNAFKYTENGGSITLELDLTDKKHKSHLEEISRWLVICIKDTGIGIPKNMINNLFQRFHIAENNKPIDSASSGIGLSLVKELIDLQGGEIIVDSIEGAGSSFTIFLPVFKNKPSVEDQENLNTEEDTGKNEEITPIDNKLNINKQQKPLVLIAEDNADLQNFLQAELNEYFEVIQCYDGAQGYEMAIQKIPDLIISDIMMENMDGITFCKKIKSDVKTSHIPVILLTARHADNIKMNSYEIGADDFITKPFNVELLIGRVNNLITQRKKLSSKFRLGIDNNLTFESTNKLDTNFIRKLNKIINDKIADIDLDSSFIASEMAMSRMQLYRKVKALTDQSINIYVRNIRMNKAAQLLVNSDLQVSEIAYRLGFSEASNFTKSFTKHFNQSPTQFKSSNKR